MQLITALVCTRNRGSSIIATISSILASEHPNFELIVIDQSTDGATEEAVAPFLGDTRLRYFSSETVGLSRARNIGLRRAQSEIVAMTDDDCEVPVDWLDMIAGAFITHKQVALVFCNVDPVFHDRTAGFIPAYHCMGSRMFNTLSDKCKARGIGAGMAVRRNVILSIGGFDEMLGAGGVFASCEDGDLTIRTLAHGHQVYETDSVSIQHDGFRTWEEGRALARRDFFGIGSAHAKLLKCGRSSFVIIPIYEFYRYALLPPLVDLLHFRRPKGLTRIVSFIHGFVQGLRTPVDPKTILFRPSAYSDLK